MDDQMNPVYCTKCRQQVPRVVSNANGGLCQSCSNLTVQSQSAALPVSPAFSYSSGYSRWIASAVRIGLMIGGVLSIAGGVMWIVNVLKTPAPSATFSMLFLIYGTAGWVGVGLLLLAVSQILAVLQDQAESLRGTRIF